MPIFYPLALTLRFCFRQLDNPSWFRHRVSWPHLFTRGVVRFPPSRQGLHASCVPDPQILLEGLWVCHSLDVESLKRSPVVTWDSIMNFSNTMVVQFMLHSIRHPVADVVRRSESVKSKQIERSRGDGHKPWPYPVMSCLVRPRGVVTSPCVEHPQQRRRLQRVSTAELLLPAECLPEAAAA